MGKIFVRVLVILLIAGGLGLLSYPAVSNLLAEKNQSQAMQRYDDSVERMAKEELEEYREKARKYNDMLSGSNIEDPFVPDSGIVLPEDYLSILNLDGTMGYLEIPKIGLSLPIYHGTHETVLQKGVGHLKASAVPIGGESTHCVLTGHRGLPSAKLFTDLDKLAIGDIFYLNVLDETLIYEVDQILTVEPSDTEALRPIKGEDYVTLVTCTPYGVNSHRLFVRGHRIHNTDEQVTEPHDKKPVLPKSVVLGSLAAIALTALISVIIAIRRKQKKKTEKLIKGEAYTDKE